MSKPLHPYLMWWFRYCHTVGMQRDLSPQFTKRGPGRRHQSGRGHTVSKAARAIGRQRIL